MRGNRPARCARCPKVGPIAGRGLCGACYHRARVNGTLPPRKNNPRARVLALWDDMVPDAEMVERLGIKWESIERAEQRARKSRVNA